MIIVIGGTKGGSGKSTIATNFAVFAAQNGMNVLLADADQQRSTIDWSEQRSEYAKEEEKQLAAITTIGLIGKNIHEQLATLRKKFDLCIVDAGGRESYSQRSALVVADKFIVPFKPRSFDVWTLGATKTLVSDVQTINPKLKAYYVINQADYRGKDNEDAMAIIDQEQFLSPIPYSIGHRKAFPNAASMGCGVSELKKPDKSAIEEIMRCYEFVISN